jgi:predicted transcriptional regulator
MARRPSVALTEGELRIMRVLWQRERATVGEVVDDLPGPPRPAYNTVLTVLRILERKGYVSHDKAGRAFTYRPLIDRGQARRSALSQLLSRFFDDSPELLVLNLMQHDAMDEKQLERLRALVSEGPPDRPRRASAKARR